MGRCEAKSLALSSSQLRTHAGPAKALQSSSTSNIMRLAKCLFLALVCNEPSIKPASVQATCKLRNYKLLREPARASP